ncbi:MAG TPA: mechanosensitive ion channel family protein [Verrucomicrobiota bacterium]|nr:mechanosensitive ion channel family protein [Verrucomicrobiota bacterium]
MTNQLINLETIEHAKQKLIDLSALFLPKAVAAALILTAGFFVARWVAGGFQRWLSRLELEPPVRQLLIRLVRLFVLLLFVLLAVTNLGFELLPLIAGLGVAGAGIAFALQGVLGNLFAGLTIIFTKPFRVGEYVEMVGVEGRVEAIELFTTRLGHPDRSSIVVPNRKIVGEILHNYGSIRQLDVIVGVAYSTDLNAALAAVNDVLNRNSHVLKEPSPVVRVSVLADSSINIAVKPWVPVLDYGPAVGEITKGVVEEFRARSISIPFPQREVRLLNPAA